MKGSMKLKTVSELLESLLTYLSRQLCLCNVKHEMEISVSQN